ncbi:MAG: hypothetical protein HY235_10025 [Acidobacteria bacterium]|nr:hypothetical protein [Acidobacteriota bacterium]
MIKRTHGRVHSPGLVRRWLEQLRGREQMLVRGPADLPLLLVSYPPGGQTVAEELRDVWLHTLPSLHSSVVDPYREMLLRLPALVVVLLWRRNLCTCLGHHHPRGTESRLTRRLAGDVGSEVGEIDLAWESIRRWRPQPLSSLAAGAKFELLHFRIAMLTVLLHELEHLAYPDRRERAVRHSSDEFYTEVLSELLRQEGAGAFGMAASL